MLVKILDRVMGTRDLPQACIMTLDCRGDLFFEGGREEIRLLLSMYLRLPLENLKLNWLLSVLFCFYLNTFSQ